MKMHLLREVGHDGFEVTTACGKYGYRNDCISCSCIDTNGNPTFFFTDNQEKATCLRCRAALAKGENNG